MLTREVIFQFASEVCKFASSSLVPPLGLVYWYYGIPVEAGGHGNGHQNLEPKNGFAILCNKQEPALESTYDFC